MLNISGIIYGWLSLTPSKAFRGSSKSRFYMYVFEEKDDADTFGFMVSKFMDKTGDVKLGQKFWPEYRYCVQKAVNYNQVNNIDFNVKVMDVAYNVHKTRKPRKPKSTGTERVNPQLLYKK